MNEKKDKNINDESQKNKNEISILKEVIKDINRKNDDLQDKYNGLQQENFDLKKKVKKVIKDKAP